MALRGAFEAPEYVEGCRRANDGVKAEASATDACESINLKNAPEQVCASSTSLKMKSLTPLAYGFRRVRTSSPSGRLSAVGTPTPPDG